VPLGAVTFIEVHVNEDQSVLEQLIRDAYKSIYQKAPPSVRFGRVIVWSGRMFQQLELSTDSNAHAFEYEDRVFRCWSLPDDRARVQVGSIQGDVFTTPPEAKGELAARIKEGGRCGRVYMVKPFQYSDFHHES
jgi:hypothetical protein